ncbi:MAG: PepSY-associated TM helix domain-containing protein [Myxococcota bacterium]
MNLRSVLVVVHRWCGLFLALFLTVAGLTGAIISWDHELDAWLNPKLYQSQSGATAAVIPALELANRLEQDARLRVAYLALTSEPGEALLLAVEGRLHPETQRAVPLDFDQVALDPSTGAVQGSRKWGVASLSRENLLPFLYKLHFSLHIPDRAGLEIGKLFMGFVACVWVIDVCVALWISFPNRKSWRKSLSFRFGQGRQKLNFDLHRSGGVWLWGLLLIVAVTSVSMALRREVTAPLVSLISPLTPRPFDLRVPTPGDQPIEPTITRERAVSLAEQRARQLGITAPAGGVAYAANHGLYAVGFFEHGRSHGDGGLGNPWLYFDATTGSYAGAEIPGRGSAGDIFMQAQFPLHSGRILGVPGRISISLLGLAIAGLSVTGIIIWAQRRRARSLASRAQDAARTRADLPRAEESLGYSRPFSTDTWENHT